MKNNFSKGFTLLELLVVIAVIGILTAIVIASLSSSRNKSADAAIKSNLTSVRSQAELVAPSLNNSYGTYTATLNCPAIANTSAVTTIFYNPTIKEAMQKSGILAGGVVTGSGVASRVTLTGCAANGRSWAAASVLKSSNTQAWCVDSSGASKQVTLTTANNATTAYTGTTTTTYACR